jgi:plastocyanin
MRRAVLAARLFAGLYAITVAAAACGPAGQSPSGSPVVAEPDSPTIGAKDSKFDKADLAVPAGRALTLVFENREGTPHNVSFYTDESTATNLFTGEIFGGPGTKVYAVSSLAPGTYYFRCDVHHDMHGTVTATAPTPGPSSGAGTPAGRPSSSAGP